MQRKRVTQVDISQAERTCISYVSLCTESSPVSIQTQSLALRALRKRKPQETQSLAFLAVFVYATNATQATAFEWKPGLTVSLYIGVHVFIHCIEAIIPFV